MTTEMSDDQIKRRREQSLADAKKEAEAAYAQNDAKTLYALHVAAEVKIKQLQTCIDALIGTYAGGRPAPMRDEDSINAMKEVAMSAIALAKAFAPNQGK